MKIVTYCGVALLIFVLGCLIIAIIEELADRRVNRRLRRNQLKIVALFLCVIGLHAQADPIVAPDVPPASMTTPASPAQPAPIAAMPQGFIASVESYFSSFDTNSQTFSTNAPYQLWTGAAFQGGINLGAQVGIEGNPISKWPALSLGSVSTLAATVGTIAQEEFDIGYSIRHYDVRLTLGMGVVDTFHGGDGAAGIKGSIFASVEKALSANTFAGVRVEGLFAGGSKANVPMFGIFGGFTF